MQKAIFEESAALHWYNNIKAASFPKRIFQERRVEL
jgi:hypothetical protein